MKKISIGKIVIGVFTVILTLSLILFIVFGIRDIRDANYEPSYLTEESYLSALSSEDYLYLLDMTLRDSRLGKEHTETVKACQSVAKYYEAISLYQAYLAVGDTDGADKQMERMKQFAAQAGDFEGDIENINELFALENKGAAAE
ncbi:MAG: hypothetical protein KH828_13100 [Clostridiales bacterium]|nr:hypothetical protein [Clostridiales bacterium]